MRKRLTALLLCLCMVLTMLPVSAMAAVGDLLGNTPEQNASLLEKLESFTGESAEEAQQLLDSLGLLDEDGNLITDQTIDLDGKQYTLEEMEALLADPSTDLTRVAQVDGVPIALQDLQTIVAIERELQYLQETYFSGRTFSGEARENLNGLLNQLQTQGMTLNATTPGNEVVLDTEGQGEVRATTGFDYSASFISSGIGSSSVPMKEGDTYSVKFKLAIPESIQKLRGDIVVGFANHMDVTDNNMLTSVKAETITVNENMNPDTEYTLEYTVGADDGPNNGLYLYVSYQFFNLPSGNTTTIKDPLGDVYGGVSFYEPSGFLFGSGDGSKISKIEDYNLFFVRDIEETTLVDSWAQTGTADDRGVNAGFATFNIIKSTAPEDYQQLDKTLGYLQSCIDGELSEDNAIRFQIESDLVITSSSNQSEALLSSLGLFANYNGMSVGGNPYNFQVDTGFVGTSGFPINLTVGGGTKNIKFNAFRTEEKSDAELKYLPRFIYVLYGTDDTTTDTSNVKDVYYTTTTTSNTTVTLVDPKTGNETKPTLTITAPAGTYKSGDLVPITITGDEYIKASADATVTINNTPYQLSDLHSSTDGKFISFLYEVKEIDSATLTVQSVTGITDFFGNDAKEVSGAPISGVELATPQMKNAVERLGVTYTDGALHFTIAAKQDEAYQNFYANNKDALMQLLITVDDGAPVTHAVTVGEDTVNNGFTFTADPYTIAPTTQEQTVTVQLQVNTGTAGTPSWVTVNRVTQTVTVDALLDVTGVTATVVDGAGQIVQPGTDDKYTVAMDEMEGKTYKLQAAFTPADATYQTGTWHSSDATIATVSNGGEGNPEAGTIQFQSQTGEVEFWFVADNGTEATEDDKESPHLTFVVTAGNSLILSIPPYAQDSLIQADKDATVSWVTNVFDFYPDADVTFTVGLFAGTETTGTPIETYTVENLATTPEKITECTIPAADLPVTYPQSQYTVQVSMTSPEARSDDTGITVLSPPTEMRITADKTSITDVKTLELNYSNVY